MPVVLLERVPLPSLRTYTAVSFALFLCVLFNSHRIVTEHQTEDNDTKEYGNPDVVHDTNGEADKQLYFNYESDGYFLDLSAAMLQETWCIWVLVNMAYCCLILFGKLIQKIIFGELRVVEQQQLKDKFWNFMFYKFIFVFGVMNVQTMEEVALWCAWFSVLGFLHLLAQLCRDRFQYLCSSPATPMWTHAKVLVLLIGIECACFCLLGVCFLVGLLFSGKNTFAFMAAECILLVIKGLHVIVRYCIHLWDLTHEGIWENRALYVYYSELIFELSALSVDFMHHLHMLLWGNIFLSMASLVICMQLRFLFHEFQRRVKRHKNYLRVVNSMEAKFPMAQGSDLEKNSDDCAICWEKMDSARILPCGHLFHNSCLRSWLEQDTTCPTCRQSLSDPSERENVNVNQRPGAAGDMPEQIPQQQQNPQQLYNHFFHFDGSRYVSWFPSFSVEVTHTTLLGERNTRPVVQNSQMDNMARQVREVFPDVPLAAIQEDLQRTRSVQITLENIIEGTVGVTQNLPRNVNQDTQPVPSTSSGLTEYTSQNALNFSQADISGQQSTSNLFESPTYTNLASVQDQPTTAAQSLTDLYTEQQAYYSSGLENTDDTQMYVQQRSTSNLNLSSSDLQNNANQSSFNSFFDDNLPVPTLHNNERDEVSEETCDDSLHISGSRFSKSPAERESILQQRKQSLLEQARRQYLNTHTTAPTESSESSGSEGEAQVNSANSINMQSTSSAYTSEDTDLRRRRHLAYEAACRRLNQN